MENKSIPQDYTKRPITIQAIQFDGRDKKSIEHFVGKELKVELESETAYVAGVAPPIFSIIIPTLEGDMKAMMGDYIIRGLKGEFYPCQPDIFEASYSPAKVSTPVLDDKEEFSKEDIDAAVKVL